MKVSEAIGEKVDSFSKAQIVAYNQDSNYLYWFSASQYTHVSITREARVVRQIDDWYHYSHLTVQSLVDFS